MTIAERHGTGILSPEARNELTARVDAELAGLDAEHGISARVAAHEVRMLGTSGTVTTLGGVNQGLRRYDRMRVDGSDITFAACEALIERMDTLDVEGRARIPCIGRQRADLMAAGCALLRAIIRHWPVGSLRVADRGIREGILLELMAADGVLANPVLIPDLASAESPA
jgi:exopolyphosphatase/guanosine-5'-triphosphate,3'-diphosphate pyrophosphatase